MLLESGDRFYVGRNTDRHMHEKQNGAGRSRAVGDR
jgi:hypothetical protein